MKRAPTSCEESAPRQGSEPPRLLRGRPQARGFAGFAAFSFLSLESRKRIAPRQTDPKARRMARPSHAPLPRLLAR